MFIFSGTGTVAALFPTLNLVFIDGSEHWNTAIPKFPNSTFGTHSAPASGVAGAHGLVTDDATWDSHGVDLTPISTLTGKMRVRFRALGDEEFLFFTGASGVHVLVELKSTGAMQVRGGGGSFSHVTSTIYAIDTWYEVECVVTINNTTGSYKLLVDSVVPSKSGGGTMEQSGLDTQNGATSTANNVKFGAGTTIDTYADDHAIDASGNEIGLGQVETLWPTGAGNYAQLTRGGTNSGANWSQCDEALLNSDTDYVVSTGSNQRDSYALQNRSLTGTPRAVQVTTSCKLASGTPTFKNFLRIGGVDYDGTVTHTATSTYRCYVDVWNTNPATSAAWTDADINALEPGILWIDANGRMTQIVVEVWVTT